MTRKQLLLEKKELLDTLKGCGGFGAWALEDQLQKLENDIQKHIKSDIQKGDSMAQTKQHCEELTARCESIASEINDICKKHGLFISQEVPQDFTQELELILDIVRTMRTVPAEDPVE